MKIMKRIKIWSSILLLSLVFITSSCLKGSDNSSDHSYLDIVKVESLSGGTPYFVTSAGKKLIPSSTSYTSVKTTNKFTATSGLAYIVYSKPESETTSTTSENIELTYAASLQSPDPVITTKGSSEDVVAQYPIISLDALNSNTSDDRIALFDANTLMIATNFYFSQTSGHTCSLVFYPSEVTSGANELNLYLRHRSTDSGSDYTTAYYASYVMSMYLHSYDITSVRAQFKTIAGQDPIKITIHAPVNTNTNILPETETTYSINTTTTTE